MSSGTELQEMEVGTAQSKTAVNSGASAPEGMEKLAAGAVAGQSGNWEDLGGPTPENYKTDDDSAKLKPSSLKTVSDVVTKSGGSAEAMHKMKEDQDTETEEVISEEEVEDAQEVVAEEEVTSEEQEVVQEYNIDEDVEALVAGEELSEEFKEKAKTIFESAINSKVAQIEESLQQVYASALEEEVAEIKESLTERVDSYLEYVADEWMAENALAIEHGLKTEMTESFIAGMKELFEDHYVSIPEDKYDVLESMVEKLDDMETKLNEQIEKNISLNKRLSESVADGILDQVSEGLAVTQKEKLASLAESVEFESETQYREKLEMLKESYFSSKSTPKTKSETLSEGVDTTPESISGPMSSYVQMMQRMSK
jgi:hypothetical protein